MHPTIHQDDIALASEDRSEGSTDVGRQEHALLVDCDVAQHQHQLGHLGLVGGPDQDRSVESSGDLCCRPAVGMKPVQPFIRQLERILEGPSGRHGRLGVSRHSVHRVGNPHAVPVDGGLFGELVAEVDDQPIPHVGLDVRPGDEAIVAIDRAGPSRSHLERGGTRDQVDLDHPRIGIEVRHTRSRHLAIPRRGTAEEEHERAADPSHGRERWPPGLHASSP